MSKAEREKRKSEKCDKLARRLIEKRKQELARLEEELETAGLEAMWMFNVVALVSPKEFAAVKERFDAWVEEQEDEIAETPDFTEAEAGISLESVRMTSEKTEEMVRRLIRASRIEAAIDGCFSRLLMLLAGLYIAMRILMKMAATQTGLMVTAMGLRGVVLIILLLLIGLAGWAIINKMAITQLEEWALVYASGTQGAMNVIGETDARVEQMNKATVLALAATGGFVRIPSFDEMMKPYADDVAVKIRVILDEPDADAKEEARDTNTEE